MSTLRYLTHPQVVQDPNVPVPCWGLSEVGLQRLKSIGLPDSLQLTETIVTSAETKAIETAEVFASLLNIKPIVRERMHENDRSSTGFIEPSEFERLANAFFAEPEHSVRGWERASDAQNRITSELEEVLSTHKKGDLLIVGHGAVGTLLYCQLACLPINRSYDQPYGGGNFFSVDIASRQALHSWRAVEDIGLSA